MAFDLRSAIRTIPDFPKPGVLFYDITSVLMDSEAFRFCVDEMVGLYTGAPVDAIAAVESRGFLFAAPLALRLSLPVILVRKKGKLPGETYSKSYSLEYGMDTIEVHKADLGSGQRILVVDDLVATGGTLRATADLIEDVGSSVYAVFSVIGLPFLNYQERLGAIRVDTLVEYDAE